MSTSTEPALGPAAVVPDSQTATSLLDLQPDLIWMLASMIGEEGKVDSARSLRTSCRYLR